MPNEITGIISKDFSTNAKLKYTTSLISDALIFASIKKSTYNSFEIIIFPISITGNISNLFGITLVYFVEIQSMIQRNDSFVDIIAIFTDFVSLSTTMNSIQYSTDGINFFNATQITNDPANTMNFPFIADGSTRNFVWDAQTDLTNGYFENIKFRINVTNGSSNSIDTFNMPFLDLVFGLGYFPPSPKSFQVFNVDDTPIAKAETSWQLMLNSNLRNNYLLANKTGHRSAIVGIEPDYLSAHTRTVIGYELFRNPTKPFSPPMQGTKIADEAVLTSSVNQFSDIAVNQGDTKHYKIATVINI